MMRTSEPPHWCADLLAQAAGAMLARSGVVCCGPTNRSNGASNDGRDDMTTRREFVAGAASAAMAGVAFVGCDLLDQRHAHAQGAPRRREVVVNGRRVRTVDIHSHCAFPQAMALMG